MPRMEVRVCLTQECNFKCRYCREGGEGAYSKNNLLKKEEINFIINKLTEFGVESVRFTGGEPLLRLDFIEIADNVNKIENIESISLVTNGSVLSEEKILQMKELNIKEVTVSLDTLDAKKFEEVARVNCFDKVIDNIKLLRKHGIPTRINTVVTKSNISEIDELIQFCKDYGITLKLLDLVENSSQYWSEEFIPLTELRDKICKMASNIDTRYPNKNKLGTPMDKFEIDNIEVLVKDNTIGTCYLDICNECELYPCQAGIVSLVLTHDGFLKICSCSNKFNLDLKPLINNDQHTYEKLRKILGSYSEAQYKDVWYQTIKERRSRSEKSNTVSSRC